MGLAAADRARPRAGPARPPRGLHHRRRRDHDGARLTRCGSRPGAKNLVDPGARQREVRRDRPPARPDLRRTYCSRRQGVRHPRDHYMTQHGAVAELAKFLRDARPRAGSRKIAVTEDPWTLPEKDGANIATASASRWASRKAEGLSSSRRFFSMGRGSGWRGGGKFPRWRSRPPLTLTLSPRKSGEREHRRDLSQPIKLAVLRAQIGDVGRDAHAAAGGALDQLGGGELAAVPVDVLAQPGVQRAELARADLGRDLRDARAARRRRTARSGCCRACSPGTRRRSGRANQCTSCRQPSRSSAGRDAEVRCIARAPGVGQILDREPCPRADRARDRSAA